MSPAATAPDRISVCMYQVGFGDCIMLSFHYPSDLPDGRRARHLLFDFGSTRWPKGHTGRYPEIATDVATRTSGVLDAIVITHRHKDHIGGYGIAAAADAIAALKPRAVVRPWTENPKAAAKRDRPHSGRATNRRIERFKRRGRRHGMRPGSRGSRPSRTAPAGS